MSRRILDAPAPPGGIRLPYGPDAQQFGDLWLPADHAQHPVVVALHGGFWRARYDLTYMGHLCAALAAVGIAAWNVEYRRLGQEGGGWPGTFEDAARAADHLPALAERYSLDLQRVVAVGHSAGGQLALWLAARARIPAGDRLHREAPLALRGVVALAGVVDLRQAWDLALSGRVVGEFMGGGPDERPERYATASPAALLPFGVPQVVIHGTADADVPYALSRDYQELATAWGDDAQLLSLPDVDHFAPVDPQSPEWPLVLQSMVEAVGAPRPRE